MRRFVHALACVALLATLAAPLVASAQRARDDAPLDIGAMFLTPADLGDEGLEGYGVRAGWLDTLDDELLGYVASDAYPADELTDMFEEAGFQRTVAVQLDLPSEEDPAWAARRVRMYLDEYTGDADLSDFIDVYFQFDATEVEGTQTIGDESRMVQYTDVNDDEDASPVVVLALGFRTGNVVGQIEVVDFENFSPDAEPTVEEIEALALRLVDRIEAVQEDGGPGLEHQVLRLESDGDVVRYGENFYSRIDGESFAAYGETARETRNRDRDADNSGVIGAYSVSQLIGGGGTTALRLVNRLRSFEDEDAASAWVQETPELTADQDGVEDQTDPKKVRRLGDEALTFTYTTVLPNSDRPLVSTFTAIRVGSDVATISVDRWDEAAPAEIVDELTAMQVECMEEASCTTESPAPDSLLELARDDLAGAGSGDDGSDTTGDAGERTEANLLDRVETYEGLTNIHVDGPVDYDQVPPVGGDHSAVLQDCGFYDEPVGSEHAVHSLEHGAVWITYDPELPRRDVRALEALVEGYGYVLVSPFEGLPAPVVASAWGVQLQLDGVDDPYLPLFIDYYEQGPQTPEPGAPCSGGTDETAG